jgi:hypothetical protein
VFGGIFSFEQCFVEFVEEVEGRIQGLLSDTVGSLPSLIEFEVTALGFL